MAKKANSRHEYSLPEFAIYPHQLSLKDTFLTSSASQESQLQLSFYILL